MSFCRDQHRHNYGAKKRCPFFHFFAHERKTNDERPNDQKSGLIIRSDDLFLHTHTHTHPKHKAEEEEDKEDEDEDDEERETTALLFIRISFCHLLKQISSSLKSSSVLRLRESAYLFFFCCTKGHVQLRAFFDTKFNDNKNNNHYNNKR